MMELTVENGKNGSTYFKGLLIEFTFDLTCQK